MNSKSLLLAALAGSFMLTLGACDKKGPVEQAAEEVDEAIDTAKNGEESSATKLDDAVDDLREGAEDAAKADPVAQEHGAGVAEETSSAKEAYAGIEFPKVPYKQGWLAD